MRPEPHDHREKPEAGWCTRSYVHFGHKHSSISKLVGPYAQDRAGASATALFEVLVKHELAVVDSFRIEGKQCTFLDADGALRNSGLRKKDAGFNTYGWLY